MAWLKRVLDCLHTLPFARKANAIHDTRFQYAVGIVLQHEGGESNDKYDKGGITTFGISQRFLDDENIKIPIHELTEQQATIIYRNYFWNRYHYDDLRDLSIATKVFDLAVNMGPSQAAKILQYSIRALRPLNPLAVDGILGAHTIASANDIEAELLLDKMRELAKEHYEEIVLDEPHQKKFLAGWLTRAAW